MNRRSRGLEEETYDAGHTPYVRTRAPPRTEDDFRTPVLPCLDVVGEVVLDPGRCVHTPYGQQRADVKARATHRFPDQRS